MQFVICVWQQLKFHQIFGCVFREKSHIFKDRKLCKKCLDPCAVQKVTRCKSIIHSVETLIFAELPYKRILRRITVALQRCKILIYLQRQSQELALSAYRCHLSRQLQQRRPWGRSQKHVSCNTIALFLLLLSTFALNVRHWPMNAAWFYCTRVNDI